MLTPEQKAAGWIEHDGGPVGRYVPMDEQVLFRSGKVGSRMHGWAIWHDLAPMHNDIIAYREPKP